ncbi:MAG: SiaC family regulatory phosphoprotein [Bacteroidales bacterium]|jgi:sulfatase maturation enzyme AslB (radical SAM superfamily)|nr:SiaC family regulatory phosphoprotein [Bacteroidales bacterium]
MEDLQIEPTKNTPLIDFFSSGKLVMAGNAYAENAKEFFDPILDWVENLHAEEVDFDLIIEYINTSSAKKLLELLNKLQSSEHIKNLKVKWFYEEWDEDGLETGQALGDSLHRINFEYVKYQKKK